MIENEKNSLPNVLDDFICIIFVANFKHIRISYGMLEFKNTSVQLLNDSQSKQFSLVVGDGDVACLCGAHGSGKSRVLCAVLGLAPTKSGFITIDGEIVAPGSAYYFRKMMAYVPQAVPTGEMSVECLVQDLLSLHVNASLAVGKDELFGVWRSVGIDESFYDKSLDALKPEVRKIILMSILPLLKRKIVLIDDIVQSETSAKILSVVSSGGAEVVYTCVENRMRCNKIVNL